MLGTPVDSDDPIPYVDYTLQSRYSTASLDTLMQSNKLGAVIGDRDQTKEALLQVIAEAAKNKASKSLLRPSHFGSNVHSGADKTPVADMAMYTQFQQAHASREADIAQFHADTAAAKAEADRAEAERAAAEHRWNNPSMTDRFLRKITPTKTFTRTEKIVPDPTPSQNLAKVTDGQDPQLWATLGDATYHPVTLDSDAVDVYNETKGSIREDIVKHYASLPQEEFIPMMIALAQRLTSEGNVTSLIIPAYQGGAGMNLTFRNIEHYRSIHAHATME